MARKWAGIMSRNNRNNRSEKKKSEKKEKEWLYAEEGFMLSSKVSIHES